MHPKQQRESFRSNQYTGTTSGMCDNFLQANMIILPKEYAFEFLLFCQRNPKSCPIVDVLEEGVTTPKIADADVRTDLPKYRIYRNGQLDKEVTDINEEWQADFVTFLIGCSFTFEKALLENGIRLLHQEQDRVVPMYKTNIPCEKAGRFEGNIVVSMRALKTEEIDKAVKITERFETSHGTPVHIGNPEEIGITDIDNPDYGESISFDEEERTPVFWACGVTPQNVGLNVKPPIMIAHAPGHMLITDQLEEQ
ncbi:MULTISPECIES: putative hydro-lyase [unclassified Oceanobacillus]|uniref:putative hydro-lyase n=1 Tax=unclassified Oceanobacillus TaxID=2630292 RepID=UPI001BE555E8|nr:MULTISPECIES: putative hydro-lyase [unclassified Oceanobacillus]MBT2600017.1 putative hydro-lyase [Oceanobacillus sp. ISL-74]MBT2652535.1 putative hydro-lyase [Oceanobacillus sp. ISL-73]